ncbi:MAG: chloride channel protein [Verrucomicrobiales bacterium]|nr:chloride channel protein [Verrucomicrobiales bacterium]
MIESDAHIKEEPEDDVEEAVEVPEEEPAAELVYRRQFFSSLRRHLNYSLFILAAIAIPLGVLAAYGTYGFRLAFGMLDVWLHKEGVVYPGVQQIVLLIAGGLLFGWVLKLLNWDRFRTPAHVIVAVSEREGKIPLKDGLITALADALCLGMGTPVGRYGPAIFFGATLGSVIARLFKLGKTSVNILLGCGVAAAISAAFNAPIAGVIFAHEVIIGHFRLRSFAPITLASVAAVAITRYHNFEYVTLKIFDTQRQLSLWDYPVYLFIGLAASVVAMIYMSGIVSMGWFAQKSRIPIWAQPAIGGAFAGFIALGIPGILGLGDDTILVFLAQDVSSPQLGLSFLVLLCLGKLAASSICLGLRMPGGSFSPAIFVGSSLGAICGLLIPSIDYQIAVLVGMGALVSSVMGAPLATILIVFELTENYEAATAVMVGVVASNAIVTRYYARSLFHRQIRMWGIDLSRPEEQRIMQAQRVSEVMDENYLAVRPERTVSELRRLVTRGYRSEVFIIDENRKLIGQMSLTDLVIADDSQTAGELAEFPEIWLKETDSVWAGFVSLENFEGVSVPVVNNAEDMELVGAVFASDFV